MKRSRVFLIIIAVALVALLAATAVLARKDLEILWLSAKTRSSSAATRASAYEGLLALPGPRPLVALISAYARNGVEVEPSLLDSVEVFHELGDSGDDGPRAALERLAASDAPDRRRFLALYLLDVLATPRDERSTTLDRSKLLDIAELRRMVRRVGSRPYPSSPFQSARLRVVPPASLGAPFDLPYGELEPLRTLRALAKLRGCSLHEHDDSIEITRP